MRKIDRRIAPGFSIILDITRKGCGKQATIMYTLENVQTAVDELRKKAQEAWQDEFDLCLTEAQQQNLLQSNSSVDDERLLAMLASWFNKLNQVHTSNLSSSMQSSNPKPATRIAIPNPLEERANYLYSCISRKAKGRNDLALKIFVEDDMIATIGKLGTHFALRGKWPPKVMGENINLNAEDEGE